MNECLWDSCRQFNVGNFLMATWKQPMRRDPSCKSYWGQTLLPSTLLVQPFTTRSTGKALRGLKLLPRMRQMEGKNILNRCFSSWDDWFGFLATVGKEAAWDLSCLVKFSRHSPWRTALLLSAHQHRETSQLVGSLPCARDDGNQTHLSPLRDEGTSCPAESSHVVPPDMERLLGFRLFFILMSMERMRKSCTNSCNHWRSLVVP